MSRELIWIGSTRPNRRTAGTGFRRCLLTTGFGVLTLMAGANVGATAGWFRAGSERESRPAGEAGQSAAASPGAIDPDDPAGAGRYAGRVLGPDGRPLAGARLYLIDAEPIAHRPLAELRAVTDASGRFQFSAPDMTDLAFDRLPVRRAGVLLAMADGYGPAWVKTAVNPEATEWALNLVRDVPIHGRLLDRKGQPLAGVSVRVRDLIVPNLGKLDNFLNLTRTRDIFHGYGQELYWPSFVPGLTSHAVTDQQGRFRLEGLGGERMAILDFQGATIQDSSITAMTREAPDSKPEKYPDQPWRITYGAGFELRLEPGRSIAGIVRDKQTGEPVDNMWVTSAGLQWLTREGRSDYSTDARGRFAIAGFPLELTRHELWAYPQPGSDHFMAMATIPIEGDVVIECPRGIPYRLRLVDETGAAVEAEVAYYSVFPNPIVYTMFPSNSVQGMYPLSRAKRQDDGTYIGAIIPGPGVVVAKPPLKAGYRPAHVDPKAFFAPGKSDWKPEDENALYGNHTMICITHMGGPGGMNQSEFAAIVLVNPSANSGPLNLAATVVRDRPRQLTVVDPEGKPVIGVRTQRDPYNMGAPLRSATFPLVGLHPDRLEPILFVHDSRKLVGFLMARGDGDTPYTVRLEPWGTITGRLLDERGQPLAGAHFACYCERAFPPADDPWHGQIRIYPQSSQTDEHGRFTVEPVVPGLGCTVVVNRIGMPAGQIAFKDVKVVSGRTRDLGDIQLEPIPDHP
jgi:hypothetical protein